MNAWRLSFFLVLALTLGASLRLRAAEAEPVDLRAVVNSSFADETPMDGTGGWTDQGANNDMRSLPAGRLEAHGVAFEVLPASGKSCLALAEPDFRSGKAKDHAHHEPNRLTVSLGGRVCSDLYLLHATGWTPDDEQAIGFVDVKYGDGASASLPVKALVDAGNWWKPFALPNAAVAWKGKNPSSEIGLYLSRFPLAGKPVQEVTFRSVAGMWFIAGVSTSTSPIELPKYAAPSFEYTQERLARDYPEFALAAALPQAMRGVPPLKGGEAPFRGCPGLWLNGNWKLLPVPAGSTPDAPEITATDIFVPSLMGGTKYNQKAVYQKQGKNWDKISRMWYSANLTVPAGWDAARPLRLHFEAVDFLGAVFVNGKFQALHTGRFTPFDLTLPPEIRPGQTFNLSIFVLKITEAIQNGRCAFMQGVGYEYGGITGTVTLYQDAPVAISHLRIATSVSNKKITVSCKVDGATDGLTIQPRITPLSKQSAEGIPTLSAKPAAAGMEWQADWPSPALWSPDTPQLYQLTLAVRSPDGKESLREETFGFREVAIRGDRILLNNIPVRLFGLSYEPQGNGAWERADEDFNYRYLMALRQGLGINAVRFHHIPASPAQLRAADRAGILAIDQSGLWTAGRFANYRAGEEFLKNMQTELAEWVWRDINHPSVFIWDTANEYICGSPEWTDFWMNLDRIVLGIDRSRPVEQSGSGTHKGGPMISHFHNGECLLYATSKLPAIYGEFWISANGKQPLTLPREVFTPEEFNKVWLDSLEDVVTRMRMNNATGIFPFHQLEHSFRMAGTTIPNNVTFPATSFHPGKINTYDYLNPYQPPQKQLDPQFAASMQTMFAPVAGFFRERSHNFFAGQPIRRSLYLANDSLTNHKLQVTVSLEAGNLTAPLLQQEVALAAGEFRWLEVNAPAPAQAGTGVLQLQLQYEGGNYTSQRPAAVYAPVRGEGTVRLYGDAPKLSAALQKAGYSVTPVSVIEAGKTPLILAENALDLTSKPAVNELLGQAGQQVLVLAQDKVNFADALGLAFRRTSADRPIRYADVIDRTLRKTLSDYNYPGGDGAAYDSSYALPLPQARTLPQVHPLTGGTYFTDLSALRCELPDGNAVFCQLQLQEHLEDDPRALLLVQQMLNGLNEYPKREAGSIYCPDTAVGNLLKQDGYALAPTPGESRLAVVRQAEYNKNPALQGLRKVLVYDCTDDMDNRTAKVDMVRHFTKVLVSPSIPGLWNLRTANFQPLIDAGAFCRAVNPPTLPVFALQNSQIAVAGNRASKEYDIILADNYYPLFSYYADGDKQRWVTGLGGKYPYIAAAAESVAQEEGIAFTPVRAVLRYDVVPARQIAIDGDLPEWSYEGDRNLHDWTRAQPLQFSFGKDWGIFYAMSGNQKLYLAVTGPDRLLPVQSGLLTVALGQRQVSLQRLADGNVKVLLDGRPLEGVEAKWAALAQSAADAGAAGKDMLPGFGLEVAIPQNALDLQSTLPTRLLRTSGAGEEKYPVADPFLLTLEGVSAKSEARVDISSKNTALEAQEAAPGTVFGPPQWIIKNSQNAGKNLTGIFPITSTAWTTATFSFRAKQDGDITIKLRGPHKLEDGKPVRLWVGFDNIQLNGAKIVNGDFEKAWNGAPAGWQMWSDTETKDQGQYQVEGGNPGGWIRIWHNCPAVQTVAVKAGQVLTLSVNARALEPSDR